MTRFTREYILLLHQIIIQETGGKLGVLNENNLDSAINAPYQTFDGKEFYSTKEEKAARLGFGLVSNHAFVDGNKRIGLFAMLTFLEKNSIHINVEQKELVALGIGVADGSLKYEDVLAWINKNKD